MRNLRGFLVAAIFGGLTWLLTWAAKQYQNVLYLAYPFMSRTVQDYLASFTAKFDFCLWQVALLAAIVAFLATFVLALLLRRNLLRWLGGWTAAASVVLFLYMGMWGLNYYNPNTLAESMRLEEAKQTVQNLRAATEYYRDRANTLAADQKRDSDGALVMSDFETLAAQAGEGFDTMTFRCSAFAGNRTPVKKLGFSELYDKMGFTGVTVALTGEAAVSTETYVGALPFTMCHEMAHRLSLAKEDEANFAAFLTCEANESKEFQYSGYFMAYIYCYNALAKLDSAAAREVAAGVNAQFRRDLDDNTANVSKSDGHVKDAAQSTYDSYQKSVGQAEGILTYDAVSSDLVSWYLSETAAPVEPDTPQFDPLQVEY